MKKAELIRLTEKYVAGTASEEERLKLESWYNNQLDLKSLTGEKQIDEEEQTEVGEKIFNKINQQIDQQEIKRPNRYFYRLAVAASFIAVLGFG